MRNRKTDFACRRLGRRDVTDRGHHQTAERRHEHAIRQGQIVGYVPMNERRSRRRSRTMVHPACIPEPRVQGDEDVLRQGISAGYADHDAADVTRYRRGFEWIERRNVVAPLISGAILIPDFETAGAA